MKKILLISILTVVAFLSATTANATAFLIGPNNEFYAAGGGNAPGIVVANEGTLIYFNVVSSGGWILTGGGVTNFGGAGVTRTINPIKAPAAGETLTLILTDASTNPQTLINYPLIVVAGTTNPVNPVDPVTPTQCTLDLECSAANFNVTSAFLPGKSGYGTVQVGYTINGDCNTFAFTGGTYASTGVTGLSLTLQSSTLTKNGTIKGTVSGIPSGLGAATFNIPGYCPISLDLCTPSPVFTLARKAGPITSHMGFMQELTADVSYTMPSGQSRTVQRAIGPSINGLHAEVDQQVVGGPCGSVLVKVMGQPDRAGTYNIPITIEGVTVYITVNVSM